MNGPQTPLEELLLKHEGLRTKPYKDSQGFLTIGIGRCLDTEGITSDEAFYMLRNDVAARTVGLAKSLPWFGELSERRQDVLLDMAFQLGINGLLNFRKMLDAVAAGDFSRAAAEMLQSAWAKQTPARANELARMMVEG